jgi:sporulation protein YlmC with PRC-barrel domain
MSSKSGGGPTILWSMLKGKEVMTNDGKNLGEIKEFSQNYVHVEKGTIKKERRCRRLRR